MGKRWTPHDFNARNDRKSVAIRARYGWEGYGIFWSLIEMLGSETTHKIPLDDDSIAALAFDFQMEIKLFTSFVHTLIEPIGIFQTDGESFWSERLNKEMTHYEKIIKQKSKAGKASAKARSEQVLNRC